MHVPAQRLNRTGDDPLWQQLMRVLRDEIDSGVYGADELLPSEAELSQQYGVSRTVVREALRELVQQRRIYKVKGKGAFVSPQKTELNFVGSVTGSADDLRHYGRRVTTQVIRQELSIADERESALLELPSGQFVVRLRRLRRVDGRPWMLVDTALPARLVPGLERVTLENQSLYDVLRRRYRLESAGADRWVEAVFANKQDAELLDVDTSTPLLGIESVAWLADGMKFEVYYALHLTDQVRFHIGIR